MSKGCFFFKMTINNQHDKEAKASNFMPYMVYCLIAVVIEGSLYATSAATQGIHFLLYLYLLLYLV